MGTYLKGGRGLRHAGGRHEHKDQEAREQRDERYAGVARHVRFILGLLLSRLHVTVSLSPWGRIVLLPTFYPPLHLGRIRAPCKYSRVLTTSNLGGSRVKQVLLQSLDIPAFWDKLLLGSNAVLPL